MSFASSQLKLLEDAGLLIAIMALFASGTALIVHGAGERKRMLAKRVNKARWLSAGGGGKAGKPGSRPQEGRALRTTQGLAEAEYRQIVRSAAKFGVPAERALFWYNAARIAGATLAGLMMLLLVSWLYPRSLALVLLAASSAAMAGWLAPARLVRHAIREHASAVGAALPDALELLAVCVEAGLSLENALQRVARELTASKPELAEELALTWAEINILPDRDQALANLAARVDIPVVRSVTGTLAQTLRYGTPLAASLRGIAANVRAELLTLLEEKANRLPAMMTVPVMLFIMPALFLILGGPAALKLLDTFAARGGP